MYIILHNRTIKHLTLFKMVPINVVDMLEQNQKDSWVFRLQDVWESSCILPDWNPPKHLNCFQIQALTIEHSITLYFFPFKPVLGGFASVFWIIILLKGPLSF